LGTAAPQKIAEANLDWPQISLRWTTISTSGKERYQLWSIFRWTKIGELWSTNTRYYVANVYWA